MKQSYLRGFIAGIVLTASTLMVVGTAFATVGSHTLIADYNNIKIELNGEKLTPQDALGNPVEPFAVNGTTYLPVRAVGTALGLEVEWDGATNTVKLTCEQSDPSEEMLYYPNSRVPMLENIAPVHYAFDYQSDDGNGYYAYPATQFLDSSLEDFNITDYIEFLQGYGFEFITSEDSGFVMKNRTIGEGIILDFNIDKEEYGQYFTLEPEIIIFVFCNLDS